jgi:hypothetical protein
LSPYPVCPARLNHVASSTNPLSRHVVPLDNINAASDVTVKSVFARHNDPAVPLPAAPVPPVPYRNKVCVVAPPPPIVTSALPTPLYKVTVDGLISTPLLAARLTVVFHALRL